MNFIQKRIQQKKLEQEEQLKSEYSFLMIRVEKYISIIKDDLRDIVDERKNISTELIDDFVFHLLTLDSLYNLFLKDLKQEEFTSKRTWNKKIAESAKQKAEYMHKQKKQYRVEFESIYNNFKRITKGHNFPRRNEILGLMRKAFDFDSSKYYQKNIVHEIQ